MSRIRLDRGRSFGQVESDLDVLPQSIPEDLLHPLNDFVQLDGAHLHQLLAAEREELRDQRFGPIRSPMGLPKPLHRIVFTFRRLSQRQVQVTENRSQQVVQVVGDSSRQLPDGLHLLSLKKLDLQLRLLRLGQLYRGVVFDEELTSDDYTLLVLDGCDVMPQVRTLPPLGCIGHDLHHGGPLIHRLFVEPGKPPVHKRREGEHVDLPGLLFRGGAKDLHEGVVHMLNFAVPVHEKKPDRRVFHKEPVAAFALFEAFIRFLEGGNVYVGAHHP